MNDIDTILQALAQVIYRAGRLDERGVVEEPVEPPLDALLAKARSLFERLDALDLQPTEARFAGGAAPLTKAEIRAALRPFASCYQALLTGDGGGSNGLAQVQVDDLARAAAVYWALDTQC